MVRVGKIKTGILKIVIITQGASIIVKPLINSRHKVVGIVESPPRIKLSKARRMILNALMYIYSILLGKTMSLKFICLKNDIPYRYMSDGCDSSLETWIKNLKPDLIIVYSMSELLKDNIIRIPRMGVINLHPSLLPKYRGPNPYFWLYYNKDLNAGISVHFIDSKEDAGDIICQKKIRLRLGTKKDEVMQKISEEGPKLILEAVDLLSRSAFSRFKQPKASPTFRARNVRLEEYKYIIKWYVWSVERIWHFLGGTEEFITELTKFNKLLRKGMKIKVLDFQKCKLKENYKPSWIYREQGRYFIACRNGKIYIQIKFNFRRLLQNLII